MGTSMNFRSKILTDAEKLINGDRNNAYGPPSQDFERTAIMWSAYLDGRTILEAHDVAAMMCLLKVSRLSWQPDNQDSWTDLAGYAACGYETTQTKVRHTHAD